MGNFRSLAEFKSFICEKTIQLVNEMFSLKVFLRSQIDLMATEEICSQSNLDGFVKNYNELIGSTKTFFGNPQTISKKDLSDLQLWHEKMTFLQDLHFEYFKNYYDGINQLLDNLDFHRLRVQEWYYHQDSQPPYDTDYENCLKALDFPLEIEPDYKLFFRNEINNLYDAILDPMVNSELAIERVFQKVTNFFEPSQFEKYWNKTFEDLNVEKSILIDELIDIGDSAEMISKDEQLLNFYEIDGQTIVHKESYHRYDYVQSVKQFIFKLQQIKLKLSQTLYSFPQEMLNQLEISKEQSNKSLVKLNGNQVSLIFYLHLRSYGLNAIHLKQAFPKLCCELLMSHFEERFKLEEFCEKVKIAELKAEDIESLRRVIKSIDENYFQPKKINYIAKDESTYLNYITYSAKKGSIFSVLQESESEEEVKRKLRLKWKTIKSSALHSNSLEAEFQIFLLSPRSYLHSN